MRRRRAGGGNPPADNDDAEGWAAGDGNDGDGARGAPATDAARASAAAAIAAEAGSNTWKTWARRKDGDDSFQLSDLWNGLVATVDHSRRRRRGDKRSSGKSCPICDDAEPEPDAEGKRWLRLYCGCTVCPACVRGWNMSLLEGGGAAAAGGGGPAAAVVRPRPRSGGAAAVAPAAPKLHCPVCSSPMRPDDAEEVIRRIPSVGAKWDAFTRDSLLRSMPDFRSCPHCEAGGFTTPECLAPRHTALIADAHAALQGHGRALTALYAAFALGLARDTPPLSVAAFAAVVAAVGLAFAWAGGRAASDVVTAPLSVGCPECGNDYLLKGFGESPGGERETEAWLNANTRPCPACGSRIEKSGGCNAMICTRCRSPFCWACMRAKSECTHMRCANGAPFGDYRDAGGGAAGGGAGGGRAGAADTPAARAGALVDQAGVMAAGAFSVAVGAVGAWLAGADQFSALAWAASVSLQAALLGVTAALYAAAGLAAVGLVMVGARVAQRRAARRRAGWG